MIRPTLTITTLMVLAAASSPGSRGATAAAPPIAVAGSVANGTAGGAVPAGIRVAVSQISPDDSEVERKETTTAPDGTWSVEGFDIERGVRFIVAAEYLGVNYSRRVEIASTDNVPRVDLTAYEITDDSSVISVPSDLLTIAGGDEVLEVIQVVRFLNASDRTYIGEAVEDRRVVLKLPLPASVFDLFPLEGLIPERVGSTRGGITTGDPLLPGETSISYAYKVRAPRGWELERAIFYETERVDVLVDATLSFASPGFRFEEDVTLSGREYRRHRGGPFRAGASLDAQIGGDGASSLLWIGLGAGVVLVAMAAAGSFLAARRRRKPVKASAAEREGLVRRIAELDRSFEQGVVPEPEYRRSREAMKKRLETMTRELSSAG